MSDARRPLGIWSATALVIGSMIGSGVFLLPASLAPYGAATLIGWGITLCGVLLLSLCFAKLAARWPQTGGPYAYARNAFGELAGFVIAWSYWISIWCGNAAIAVAFAGSLGKLIPGTTSTPVRATACALAGLWVCSAVNLAGLKEAGFLQLVSTALKLLPLLLFGAVAIWFVDAGNLTPFNPTPDSLPQVANATAALTLWALLGLEAATVPAGSIRDAERNVPRATMLGTLIAGVATILACTAVLGIVPAEALHTSQAPMIDAATLLWGQGAGTAIALVAVLSCFGALNGWVMLSAQVPLAAARDGVFPGFFARTDSKGTPVFGVVIGSVLASALVLSNYNQSLVKVFTFAILLSTGATLLPYVASSLAWTVRGVGSSRWLSAAALAYSLYALAGIGRDALVWGAVLVAAGLPVYFLIRRRAARVNDPIKTNPR